MIFLLLRFCLSFAFNNTIVTEVENIVNRGNVIYSDIDWHDNAYLTEEANRTGLGEHGAPAHAPPDDEEKVNKQIAKYGYNGHLSDLIALNRSVADIRPTE